MTKYSFIKQDGLKDCGVACISMILKHYGGFINHEKLCDLTKTTKNGTTAYNLVETLKKIGFDSYGIKYELNKQADKIILPAIAHVVIDNSYNHFVVIYEIDFEKECLIVADPASKIKRMTFNEFNKIFSNVILIAYPIRKIVKEKEITINHFMKNILFKNNFVFHISCFLFYILTSLLLIFLIKMILNGNLNIKILIFTILIIILKSLLNIIKNKKLLHTKIKINDDLINESFKDILNLPYLYYRNRTTGEIISRINDIDSIKDLFEVAIILCSDIILTILTGILLFLINVKLFIIVLLIFSLYLLNYLLFNHKLRNNLEQVKDTKSFMNSYMTEAVIGFESIKGQNLEKTFENNLKNKSSDYLNSLKKYQTIQNYMSSFNDFISDISTFIIIVGGLLLIKNNYLSYGDLLAFYALTNYFLEPLKHLVELNIIMKEIKISLKRLIDLKYQKKEEKGKNIKGKIRIKKLKFKYGSKALKPYSFDIKPKDKIMMVGSSGCGKSTILKILKQYYKAENVFINKSKINSVDIKDNITYISQDEYLFTDTLYNNITTYKNIKEEELNKIIDICGLQSLIDKNNLGINMLIEENGFNLSGGEKQRIILARALINVKNYLFIDEGLSEVDISLERQILKKLFKYYQDKTIILVSHRTNNLDLFDKLIDLNKEEYLEKK